MANYLRQGTGNGIALCFEWREIPLNLRESQCLPVGQGSTWTSKHCNTEWLGLVVAQTSVLIVCNTYP